MIQSEATEQWWVLTLLIVVGEILAVVFVIRVLTRRGSPASTLTWMLIVLLAPYVGLLLYYLLPRKLQLRRLRRRQSRLAWIEDSLDDLAEPLQPGTGPGPLGRLIRTLDPDGVHDGNRVQLQETGPEFVAGATTAIRAARQFVHLETYILRADETGLALIDLLAETAARGVEVRVLYDSFGSWSLKKRHFARLLDAGGRVQAYLPLLWRRRPFTLNLRNHRKLLVVDGEVAFLGGRNVGDEYALGLFGRSRKWLDLSVEVRGPVVARLHRVFVEDWFNAAGEDLAARRYFPDVRPEGSDQVGVVEGGPDRRTRSLSWVILQMITMAERSVDISTPYLIPHPALLLALQVVAARGARVRIHTNGFEAENTVIYQAQRSYYQTFLESGIQLSESTGGDYNHAKMILVDGSHLFVGSPNMDIRSAELNFEIGVVVMDGAVAKSAADVFERRLSAGRPLEIGELREGLIPRIVQGACRLLSPLL